MIERTDRTVNGKFKGRFYTFPDGRKLYLEHIGGEKTRSLDHKHNAWLLPTQTIREAESKGCTQIGILHKIGKKHATYIANIKDFLEPPSEIHYVSGREPMRRLNRSRFVVNSTHTASYIENSLKIR